MLKKKTEPCESTTIKVSFELSHNRFHPQTQKLEPPITEFFKEICLRLNKSSHYERVYMYQTPQNFFFLPDKDPCRPNPCGHGGFCSEIGGGFACNCTLGFKGATCLGNKHKKN